MCYLAVHHRVRADVPLLLLANRDEAYDRPFDPPHWWAHEPDIFAPRDRTGGGTWLGLSRAGLVVAITNRGRPLQGATLRSRGQLVVDALRQPDPIHAVKWLGEHLSEEPYEGFHLLLANRDVAYVVRHEGSHEPEAPGADDLVSEWTGSAHALSNLHEVGTLSLPAAVASQPDEPLEAWFDRHELLARDNTTALPGDHHILKRGATRGTVCSALIALHTDGRFLFRFANGAPDLVRFEQVLV